MDMTNWATLIGGSFFQQLPHFLVTIAGLIFSFLNLKKFPRASRMAMIGLIILLLMHIVRIFLPALSTYLIISAGESARNAGYFSLIIGFLYSLISAVGLGLVIYAVWVGRNENIER